MTNLDEYKDGLYYVPKYDVLLEKDWYSFIGDENTPEYLRRKIEVEVKHDRIDYIGEIE
jgi:hypothetical protein